MGLNLFLSHILITFISIFGFTLFYEYIDDKVFEILFAIFHGVVIFICYITSGILCTANKFSFKKYYSVALIGFIIWLIALTNSPNSLNYKQVEEAGAWFFYQLYIMGVATPFNFIDLPEINVHFSMVLLLLLTLMPSFLQAYGGYLKVTWNNKRTNKTLG